MFVLRPASSFGAAPVKPIEPDQPAAHPIAAEEPNDQPYIDEGLPVPEGYGVDIIRALLQDPFHIFIYWEVRPESLTGLTRIFSEAEAAEFRTTLKLREMDGSQEAFFEVGPHGRYWMMVFPDRTYEFEIGVRSPVYGYISLARSNQVRTPRGTVSPTPAPEPEYKMTPPEFIDVLQASGFGPEQAMDITVAAMPGSTADGEQIADLLVKLPESVRNALLVAAIGGQLTFDMTDALPEPFRSELLKLYFASDGQLATVGLAHYLPEVLREAIESERELIGDRAHPLHVTPRFFAGASESLPPSSEFHLPRPPQFRLPSSWVFKERD
ncbi:MAG: DUF4912 domain-containing protein [Blastocatellia bacterium]